MESKTHNPPAIDLTNSQRVMRESTDKFGRGERPCLDAAFQSQTGQSSEPGYVKDRERFQARGLWRGGGLRFLIVLG